MKKLTCIATLTAAGLVACGGGSGVDSEKKLVLLNAQDRIDLCEYAINQLPPPGEYTCVSGTIELEADDLQVSACVTSEFFDSEESLCTVAVFESCFDDIGKNQSVCALQATDNCRIFTEFCLEGSRNTISNPTPVDGGSTSPPGGG